MRTILVIVYTLQKLLDSLHLKLVVQWVGLLKLIYFQVGLETQVRSRNLLYINIVLLENLRPMIRARRKSRGNVGTSLPFNVSCFKLIDANNFTELTNHY